MHFDQKWHRGCTRILTTDSLSLAFNRAACATFFPAFPPPLQERDEQKAQRAKKERKLKLSFGDDEEEEEEEGEADGAKIDGIGPQVRTVPAAPVAAPAARGFGKDPTVRSDFLPDREREREEEALREQLKSEWLAQQAAIKAEPLEITYSYYNGTGHRRSVTVTKGTTVGQFLQAVYEQLAKEFREMKWVLLGNGVSMGWPLKSRA